MTNNNTTIALVALVLVILVGGFLMMRNQDEVVPVTDTTESETMMKDDTTTDDTVMMEETTMDVTLAEVTDSDTKQTGTAKLTEKDGKVEVVLTVSPKMSTPQPAHIHMGACPGVGEVAYPLTSVVNGTSTTMLDVTLAELTAQKPLAINVHKSAEEVKVYTACGGL